ncbi:MAG: transposase [Opitutales bacterium]
MFVEGCPDAELLRRFRVLYPKPTKYQTAEFARLEKSLKEGDENTLVIREQLLSRMYDLSAFMKTVKQRFSIWYNRNHGERRGTLWMDRFKSVLVEGKGNPLQTMVAYIDLNPVRAGIRVRKNSVATALQLHRELIFGKRAAESGLSEMSRQKALQVLEQEEALLPKTTVLRCRVRYFTDGAILGSQVFVRGFAGVWQMEKRGKYPLKPKLLRGAEWQGLAIIQGLRKQVFG